jgi:uncharacterized protein YndB with AHSA1/START domain
MGILLVVLVIVVGLLLVIATRPNQFRVQRSTVIGAPINVVFPLVNDFHQWTRWSPWEGHDPDLKRAYEGAPAGTGAVYSWVGNNQVGEGRMTITDSRPGELIVIKLEFIKPWTATNRTEFTFRQQPSGVAVDWAMSGPHNFMGKAFSLLMNMDARIGKDFDQGLALMKKAAEEDAQKTGAAAAPR